MKSSKINGQKYCLWSGTQSLCVDTMRKDWIEGGGVTPGITVHYHHLLKRPRRRAHNAFESQESEDSTRQPVACRPEAVPRRIGGMMRGVPRQNHGLRTFPSICRSSSRRGIYMLVLHDLAVSPGSWRVAANRGMSCWPLGSLMTPSWVNNGKL